MSFIKLLFKPGVNRDQTDYSGEGGWYACDKIRFRSGFPQKLGGWAKATQSVFIGVCRQMWNWVTTFSDILLALGTNAKVYIYVGGTYFNITPLRSTNPTMTTPDTDNCVYTTTSSNTVSIRLGAAHGATSNNYVTLSGVVGTAGYIGGIPESQINGDHLITVVNTTAFTFTTSTSANATVSAAGGTAINIAFEIDVGYATDTAGYGWGTGAWGRGAWGSGSTTPVNLPQEDWWFDNFDNDLVMNIRNGMPYIWERGSTSDPSTALNTRAIQLSTYANTAGYSSAAVPVKVMQMLVSQQDKHLIAFGAVPYGSTSTADFDPLLIRWADQDNPGQWTPAVTNSAGDLRVSRGSRIVRALPTRQEILVFTDTNLYSMQFLGTTDVFALQEYADNISIMSPRAVANAANITYWMGQDKFYCYTGRVETLPCTLRDHVFSNINLSQANQVVCGTNEQWNEVWWFYPSAGSDYNDSYVVLNHLERIWYYGTIERTAWLDTPLNYYPFAANTSLNAITSGYLYDHENGIDADGSAMESYIESNQFDLNDGDQLMLTRRLIPDISFAGSTAQDPEINLQIRPTNFPGSGFGSDSGDTQPVIETSTGIYTQQVFVRARARQMALKIISDQLGVNYQLGAIRLDARPDGRR